MQTLDHFVRVKNADEFAQTQRKITERLGQAFNPDGSGWPRQEPAAASTIGVRQK